MWKYQHFCHSDLREINFDEFIRTVLPQSCKKSVKLTASKKIFALNLFDEKLFLTKIFFREINSLVTYLLVKMLISRNFCQKSVRVNFRNLHTVNLSDINYQ